MTHLRHPRSRMTRGHRSAQWLGTRVLTPVLVGGLTCMTAEWLPASLAAARGEGTPGVFVAEQETCGRSGCAWDLGTFTATSQDLVVRDVFFVGPELDGRGDTAAALYQGHLDPESVYTAHGSKAWVVDVLFLAGGIGYFVWALWWLAVGRRPRPSGRGRHSLRSPTRRVTPRT